MFFTQKKLHYLSHVLSKLGNEPDQRKVERRINLIAHKDQKGVKSLLGLANYYKKFILGYSKLCAPLFNLLNKDTPFVWSKECEDALNTLKSAITSSPVLAFPDMHKRLHTHMLCFYVRSGLHSWPA